MNNSPAKREATHTTESYKHLYKIVPQSFWQKLHPLHTGVMFWDEYTTQWRPSIMKQDELIEI